MPTARDIQEEYKDRVENTVSAAFGSLRAQIGSSPLSREEERSFEALASLCLRPGKRLRGSLAAAAYDTESGQHYAEQGLLLGAAQELFQAYLIIVDDVMDQSGLRRGEQTLHVVFREEFGCSEHDANMLAINVGLLAQHMASLLLSDLDAPADSVQKIMQVMHTHLSRTGLGQIRDTMHQLGTGASMAEIIRTYEQKSGYYTFVAPLLCGLLLAGRDDSGDDCLAYGLPAGVAFQLRNDIDGLYSSDHTPRGAFEDIRSGRRTWLWQYAYNQASLEQRRYMMDCIGIGQVSKLQRAELLHILESTSAIQAVQQKADTYSAAAQNAARDATSWDKGFAKSLCLLASRL